MFKGKWMGINVMRRLNEQISVAPELTKDFVECTELNVLRLYKPVKRLVERLVQERGISYGRVKRCRDGTQRDCATSEWLYGI